MFWGYNNTFRSVNLSLCLAHKLGADGRIPLPPIKEDGRVTEFIDDVSYFLLTNVYLF